MRFAVLLLVCGSLLGCSSSRGESDAGPDSGAGRDAGGATVRAAFDRLADALCEHEASCCTDEERTRLGLLDRETCVRTHLSSLRALEPTIAGGRVRFDAEAAERCLAFFASASCEARALATSSEVRVTSECDRMLEGTLVDGAACTDSFFCELASACQAGVCAPRRRTGEACAASGDCDRGLACVRGFCIAPAAVGAACVEPTECATGRCEVGVCVRSLACIGRER